MKKQIVSIAMLGTIFLYSCGANAPKESTDAPATENVVKTEEASTNNERVNISQTDKSGNKLDVSFDNSKNTATLQFNGETIELTLDTTMASGTHYKNEHYQYSEWHGKTTVAKDGTVIFEAGEETMPK